MLVRGITIFVQVFAFRGLTGNDQEPIKSNFTSCKQLRRHKVKQQKRKAKMRAGICILKGRNNSPF